MVEDVGVVATCFFEGVGEDAHALVVEKAGGELAVVVDGLGEADDGGSSPGRVEGDGMVGVADEFP
jgi:hypothetical protein